VDEPMGRGVAHSDDDDDAGPAARPLPGWIALAAAAGLIAIVAFASRSSLTSTGQLPIDLKPIFTAVRVIGYVGLAIGTFALPLAIALSRARARRDRAARDALLQRQLAPAPWWARALGIAVMVAMCAFQLAVVLAFIADLRRSAGGASGSAGRAGGVLDPSALGHATDDLTALTISLVIVGALAVLIVVVAIRWRVLDAPTGVDGSGRRAAVARAVELSLDALRGEPDPRLAVIAAYAAMERSLSGAGFGRHRSEAPLEYLRRVLAAPTSVGDDVRTITLLFQHAKFSHHAVEETMRSRAIEALANIRTAIGGPR
jgi:Domain of unknown function (DUF4129)